MLAQFPVKLLAFYLFAHGHPTAGLGLLLVAKLVGTALVARWQALRRAWGVRPDDLR